MSYDLNRPFDVAVVFIRHMARNVCFLARPVLNQPGIALLSPLWLDTGTDSKTCNFASENIVQIFVEVGHFMKVMKSCTSLACPRLKSASSP